MAVCRNLYLEDSDGKHEACVRRFFHQSFIVYYMREILIFEWGESFCESAIPRRTKIFQ